MSDSHSKESFSRTFAGTRSHQDAAAANEHTRLLDQWILVINGAAATAILTFTSTNFAKSVVWPLLFTSLSLFAFGAFFGASAMRAHSRALYDWLYFWSVRAGVSDYDEPPDKEDIGRARAAAYQKAAIHDWFYRLSIWCFLLGCLSFGFAVSNVTFLPEQGALPNLV
jgi:hypothetical protein